MQYSYRLSIQSFIHVHSVFRISSLSPPEKKIARISFLRSPEEPVISTHRSLVENWVFDVDIRPRSPDYDTLRNCCLKNSDRRVGRQHVCQRFLAVIQRYAYSVHTRCHRDPRAIVPSVNSNCTDLRQRYSLKSRSLPPRHRRNAWYTGRAY